MSTSTKYMIFCKTAAKAVTEPSTTDTTKDVDMTITADTPAPVFLPMGALVAAAFDSELYGVVVEHGAGWSRVWKANGTGEMVYTGETSAWRVQNRDLTPAETALIEAIKQSYANHKGLNDARDRATVAAKELATFRERVREVAMEAAIENDMCEEVAKALDKLGLDSTMTIRVTGTFTISMNVPMHGRDLYDSVSESDIIDYVRNEEPYMNLDIDSVERVSDEDY